mmetsp:Transcript_62194/g.98940  ORF Transcript_62194/g.98940 Transcript_62194/m.98940 type:complete len:85 (+) Transcript_62194:131-385(+)
MCVPSTFMRFRSVQTKQNKTNRLDKYRNKTKETNVIFMVITCLEQHTISPTYVCFFPFLHQMVHNKLSSNRKKEVKKKKRNQHK